MHIKELSITARILRAWRPEQIAHEAPIPMMDGNDKLIIFTIEERWGLSMFRSSLTKGNVWILLDVKGEEEMRTRFGLGHLASSIVAFMGTALCNH